MLEHKDLLDLINYDEYTGIFTWKKARRGVVTGKILGCDNGFGYLRITVLGRSYYAHRLAWFYIHGDFPKNEIDHINGVKNDNRIANLRDVPNQVNAQNKLFAKSNSKSQILGVSWHKKANKWQADICIYKNKEYLGLFDSAEDAHKAYINKKLTIKYENT